MAAKDAIKTNYPIRIQINYAMKKSILLVLFGTLLFMSSCMDTFYATKKSTYDNAILAIQSQMKENGFSATGSKSNTHNETVVKSTTYRTETGYSTEMENKEIAEESYSFTDDNGNTMSYSVTFLPKEDADGKPYVEDVQLCGCETSNPKDYEKFCGNNSFVKSVNHLEKDGRVREVSVWKTSVVTGFVLIGISVGLALILGD